MEPCRSGIPFPFCRLITYYIFVGGIYKTLVVEISLTGVWDIIEVGHKPPSKHGYPGNSADENLDLNLDLITYHLLPSYA